MSHALAHPKAGLFFRLSCWILGLIAFVQLLIAGVAIALRVEAAREVRVEEKVVTRIVEVPSGPRQDAPAAKPLVALPPLPEQPAEPAMPAPNRLEVPPIADPVVERLVREAREARVAEDMGTAVLKLESALEREPKEPNTLYELALVYETMAAYDISLAAKASDAFLEVKKLGIPGAGALYPLAMKKLAEGIALPRDMRGKLALGRVRIFKDNEFRDGERVVLTIPISAAPGAEPEESDFFVKITFFDKLPDGTIVAASPESRSEAKYASGDIDWVGGEELLRVTYILPATSARDEPLFGQRTYYGQTVELFYKNELIDTQAYPRHLAAETAKLASGNPDPMFLDQDQFPPDFDPNLPLLPPLEDEMQVMPSDALPPLDETLDR